MPGKYQFSAVLLNRSVVEKAMAPPRPPRPHLQNLSMFKLPGEGKLQVADRTKVVNRLILKWEDSPGLSR